jgi:pSer/pThr/pTyr-binding forkhead associated (FHA) protein
MASLTGMSADVKGRVFQLDQEVTTLGRSKDNTIIIENPTVSGHHCSVTREGNAFILRDLESTNGTRLNGKEVSQTRLRPKDLIQVGSVEFLFDGEEVEAVETHSFAEAHVEEASGPVAAPESFNSISPFGARQKETKGLWFIIISAVGILALAGVIIFFWMLIFE